MTTGFTLALYLLTRARETQHTTQPMYKWGRDKLKALSPTCNA